MSIATASYENATFWLVMPELKNPASDHFPLGLSGTYAVSTNDLATWRTLCGPNNATRNHGPKRARLRIYDINQAGCSSAPIPRTTSAPSAASDLWPLLGLLVFGNKAVKRPSAGRNAHIL
jgi:hypothetical protein